jgi:hypothetical protein
MLLVDLTLSDVKLIKFIATKCVSYGTVKSVNVYRSPTPYAVVRMGDRQETGELARKIGKAVFEGAAIIPLKRK